MQLAYDLMEPDDGMDMFEHREECCGCSLCDADENAEIRMGEDYDE